MWVRGKGSRVQRCWGAVVLMWWARFEDKLVDPCMRWVSMVKLSRHAWG